MTRLDANTEDATREEEEHTRRNSAEYNNEGNIRDSGDAPEDSDRPEKTAGDPRATILVPHEQRNTT